MFGANPDFLGWSRDLTDLQFQGLDTEGYVVNGSVYDSLLAVYNLDVDVEVVHGLPLISWRYWH